MSEIKKVKLQKYFRKLGGNKGGNGDDDDNDGLTEDDKVKVENQLLKSMIKLKHRSLEQASIMMQTMHRSESEKRAIIDSELLKLKHKQQESHKKPLFNSGKRKSNAGKKDAKKIQLIDTIAINAVASGGIEDIGNAMDKISSSRGESLTSSDDSSHPPTINSPKKSSIFRYKQKVPIYPSGGIQGDLMRINLV